MPASKRKEILLSDEETAKVLGIRINKLYGICDFFDEDEEDEWDLIEGEHFEWQRKDVGKRRFYEAGAVAIAKYLQEAETSSFLGEIFDKIIEVFTHRRQKIRQHLVRRRVSIEFSSLDDACIVENLVFLARPKAIRILETNGKGLNYAIRRIQDNTSLDEQGQLEPGVHFDNINNVQHWSQRGIARVAADMSHNHEKRSRKSRKAWTETVFEEIENAIQEQRKYLESSEARIQKAIEKAKRLAQNKCQVTLQKRTATNPFDLHTHHLFDKRTRPDLADVIDNLLVMNAEIHKGFHLWHGSESCEPKHFIDYLLHVEDDKFKSSKRKEKHLKDLIRQLERIQNLYADHYHMT